MRTSKNKDRLLSECPQCETLGRAENFRSNRVSRARKLGVAALAALMACLASTAQAAISVPTAAPLTFDTLPAVADWSTLSLAGDANTATDAAGLDAAVQQNVTAANVNNVLLQSATQPPSQNTIARHNTAGLWLQTRPTGNGYLVLMATLQNDSGQTICALTMSYDWAQRNPVPVNESVPGHRVYWSLTGAPGTWVLIPECSNFTVSDTASSLTATLQVGAWTPGSTMYVLWADDNGPGSTDNPQEGAYTIDNVAFSEAPSTPVAIVTPPPAQTTIVEGATLNLTVVATGSPLNYQWYKQGVGEILGATKATYSVTNVAQADSGTYYVTVYNCANSVTSPDAQVTVNVDNVPPTVVSVQGSFLPNLVTVTFSEAMAPGSVVDSVTYTVSGGFYVVGTPALSADGKQVILTLDRPLDPGGSYTLSVDSGPIDLFNNPLEPVTVPFTASVISPGFLRFDYFGGLSTTVNDIAQVTSDPRFPLNSDQTLYLTAFNSRTVFPNDSHEGYGAHITGYFIPPASGSYIFYLRSDDTSQLFLNPLGTDPAGKTLLLEATAASGLFSALASAPQSLTGGQPYFIEALLKEGSGPDYIQVAAKLDTDPTPPDSLSPIPGHYLAASVDPAGASVAITQQPVSQSVSPVTVAVEDFTTDTGYYSVENLNLPGKPWNYNAARGTWQCWDQSGCTTAPRSSRLNSAGFRVTTPGPLTLSFTHRYFFEVDATEWWDGGQLRVGVNGGPYAAVPAGSFSANGYTGIVGQGGQGSTSELLGQPSFVAMSTDYTNSFITSVANLGSFNVGDYVSIQFLAAWDDCSEGTEPNWEITSVEFSPSVTTFPPVSFTVEVQATLSGFTDVPVGYQWQRDSGAGFVDVSGANSATYTLIPRSPDNGAQFRCLVFALGAQNSTISGSATLTAQDAGDSPRLDVELLPNGSVQLSWPESATGFEAQETTQLMTPPSSTVWAPASGTAGSAGGRKTLTVTPTTGGAKYYRLNKP
jgi:hypothetical protein